MMPTPRSLLALLGALLLPITVSAATANRGDINSVKASVETNKSLLDVADLELSGLTQARFLDDRPLDLSCYGAGQATDLFQQPETFLAKSKKEDKKPKKDKKKKKKKDRDDGDDDDAGGDDDDDQGTPSQNDDDDGGGDDDDGDRGGDDDD